MKHAKRLAALAFAAMLMMSLLPARAFAAGESGIQLGTAGLKAKDEIYFGSYTDGTTYEVPWIVLSKDANEAFLLSKYLLWESEFQLGGNSYYSGSTLNARMDALYNGTGFTPQERGAIATVTSLNCVGGGNSSSPSVSNAHLYPLSYNEAAALTWGSDTLKAPYITSPSGSAGWWLRSSSNDHIAFCVADKGFYDLDPVYTSYGARPAFHLDLTKVLFTSVATGGKASGSVGAGALHANLPPSGATSWKLTLLDSTRTFNVTTTTVSTTTAGGNVSIAYSGAKVGTTTAPEYLSAMLVDGSNNVLYYGRLKSIAAGADAAGTQTVTIPALSAGTYTLKIFNEQYNGDYNTDYSSAIKDVTLTVNAATYAITYNANGGSGTMAGGTATAGVAFTLPACTFTAPTGQRFKEWAIGSTSGTKAAAGSSHTFTAATAVYAIWELAPANPTITDPTQGKTVTAAEGKTATLSVTAQNAAGYQWYVNRNDGNGFVAISGATGASYTTSALTMANDGYQYHCAVSGAAGTTPVTSPVFTLRVVAAGAGGTADIPKTGDGNLPGLWLGIAILAAAGLGASVVLGRRKRRGEN